ncbi:hypothetical protein J4732_11565 [Serratia marcescens]|uniref:Uncharacterized protein n=1 Tax=Serratia marcescens TaxID=615 RepID=A0A939SUN0_SERMA|nr:hypothetical protein [Serratia marcescens]
MKESAFFIPSALAMAAGVPSTMFAPSTLRTAIFGFGSQLQLIHGRYDRTAPLIPARRRADAAGRLWPPFEGPRYRGVRTFDDCMLQFTAAGQSAVVPKHAMQRRAGFATAAREAHRKTG